MEALDSQDRSRILSAQQDLSAAAERVWARVERDASFSCAERAFVRVMSGAAIGELPRDIQDPANYRRIQHHLCAFDFSLALLA